MTTTTTDPMLWSCSSSSENHYFMFRTCYQIHFNQSNFGPNWYFIANNYRSIYFLYGFDLECFLVSLLFSHLRPINLFNHSTYHSSSLIPHPLSSYSLHESANLSPWSFSWALAYPWLHLSMYHLVPLLFSSFSRLWHPGAASQNLVAFKIIDVGWYIGVKCIPT